MIAKPEREQIIALINREVVPAIGCTEPIAVALCVAKATETLGKRPERIKALLSANILKNAMGVGIPGTGMIGLPIAIALGALIGKSEYQLEVLKDSTPEVGASDEAALSRAGRDRGTERESSDAVGRTDEQHPQPSGGSDTDRTDLQVSVAKEDEVRVNLTTVDEQIEMRAKA